MNEAPRLSRPLDFGQLSSNNPLKHKAKNKVVNGELLLSETSVGYWEVSTWIYVITHVVNPAEASCLFHQDVDFPQHETQNPESSLTLL
jgi:hypothetical protein